MKKTVFLFVLALFSITIASCESGKTPATEVKNDTNSAITVVIPSGVNTFKLNDFVHVEVWNDSDHEILLSLDNAIDVKAKQEDNWISVPLAQKLSRKILLHPQSEEEPGRMLFSIIPNVQSEKATAIRITIVGIDQVTNQEVSGYADITLNP
jgi:hypothetical protein